MAIPVVLRYGRDMADPPDLDALASRYLDFWQEQAAAMTANPALADLVSKLFAALGPGAAAAGFASPSTDHHEQSKADQERGGAAGPAGSSAPDGAAPAAAAPVADDDRLDELLRRLADLEERFAALETGGAKPRS
ncbi:MAG: hypothetical protein RLT05_15495 [Bauldia litoralis]